MAKVNICNVDVKDNPCLFTHPFQFEITFECLETLEEDLEWKIIYVGSAESEQYDQVLDTVVVGPLCPGKHMFVYEADPPKAEKIPKEDVVGVTVVLLTCSYMSNEFVRIGYYVNNEYNDPELKENPPIEPDFSKLQRNILATNPRVTRFKINWEDENKKTINLNQLSINSQPSSQVEGKSGGGEAMMVVEDGDSKHYSNDSRLVFPANNYLPDTTSNHSSQMVFD